MQVFNFRTFLQRQTDDVDKASLPRFLKATKIGIGKGVWIAGGAVRRTISNMELETDVDFFFEDEEAFKLFLSSLRASKEFRITSEKENELNVQLNIEYREDNVTKPAILQLIRVRYYGSPQEVIDSFDFTICQFAFDGEDIYCGDYSMWDLGRKRLVLHKLTFPVATMRRLIKYTQQGFYACAGCLTAVLKATVENPQLIGASPKYID